MSARPAGDIARSPIPRYRAYDGPALLSAGFRPFFLVAAIWAAIAIPLWLGIYAAGWNIPSRLDPVVWHSHEMIYGFAAAAAAGFMMTMIPNWTGKMPLQGWPLAVLVLLWFAGRIGVLTGAAIGAPAAAIADLGFPVIFLLAVAREVFTGRSWRSLPMVAALLVLLLGNALVHGEALGLTSTAALGNRVGIATFLLLIAQIGGRTIPSFTRNWIAKNRPGQCLPSPFGRFDQAALAVTGLAGAAWALKPGAQPTTALLIAAGVMLLVRLLRWRGWRAMADPSLISLHLGYGWLAVGLLLLGLESLLGSLPPGAALHALTVGAIGNMIVAVMTRTVLSQTGHRGIVTRGPAALFLLITLAAVLRIAAPLTGANAVLLLCLAGLAWSSAFLAFAIVFGPLLTASNRKRNGGPAR